jgi:hypothetical protein
MPISGEFYLVTIGSVVLSDDGTGAGRACLTKVDGLAQLFLAREGNTRIPLSGVPYNFTRAISGANVKLISKPFVVSETVLSALKTLIDTAAAASSAIAVKVEQGPGAANLDCDPLWEEGRPPLLFTDNFFEEDLYDVQISLITRGFTA